MKKLAFSSDASFVSFSVGNENISHFIHIIPTYKIFKNHLKIGMLREFERTLFFFFDILFVFTSKFWFFFLDELEIFMSLSSISSVSSTPRSISSLVGWFSFGDWVTFKVSLIEYDACQKKTH